jgi:hypothetical protein
MLHCPCSGYPFAPGSTNLSDSSGQGVHIAGVVAGMDDSNAIPVISFIIIIIIIIIKLPN